jgi:hypothetical protein
MKYEASLPRPWELAISSYADTIRLDLDNFLRNYFLKIYTRIRIYAWVSEVFSTVLFLTKILYVTSSLLLKILIYDMMPILTILISQ